MGRAENSDEGVWGNNYQLMTTSRLRELSEPAVFVNEVAKPAFLSFFIFCTEQL